MSAYIDWIRTNANEKQCHKSAQDNERLSLELSSYAMALNKLERFDDALKRASDALSLDKDNRMATNEKREAENNLKYERAKVLNQQGIDLFEKGEYEKANALFAAAYENAPPDYTRTRSKHRSNQAYALNKLKRFSEALIKANEALKLNIENKRAREERSVAEQGLMKEAAEWNTQGLVHFKAKEYLLALEYFNLAARTVLKHKRHESSFYLSNLAHTLAKLSRYGEALGKAKQALILDCHNDHARKMIAECEVREEIIGRMVNTVG